MGVFERTSKKIESEQELINDITVIVMNARSYHDAGLMITRELIDAGVIEFKNRSIGKNMTNIMDKKGISKRELSELTGIHVSSLGDYSWDTVIPKTDTLIKIADALGVTVDELVYDEVEDKRGA